MHEEVVMKKWLRRIRGALGMGLTWALVWAPVAVLIGMLVDPDGSMDEMWVAIGAYPGFLGGVVFSVVLGIAARRRRLDELSLSRVAAWGAAAGLLVGALPFTVGTSTSELPLWLLGGVVVGSITVLSAVSGRRFPGAGQDGGEAGTARRRCHPPGSWSGGPVRRSRRARGREVRVTGGALRARTAPPLAW